MALEQCTICLQQENLYPLECVHKFCLQCVKGMCLHAGRCPLCRAEFSDVYKRQMNTAPQAVHDFGTAIDARILAMLDTNTDGGAWVYSDRLNRAYWLYDECVQRELREAEARTDVPRVVYATVCGRVITIDLDARRQVNTSTRAVRKIRKCSKLEHESGAIVIKGIAGMPK